MRSTLRAANLPPPLHLLPSFARYRHLSFKGKLQIGRALLALKMRPRAVRPAEAFAEWLKRHGQGRETIRSFWEPFLVPALNAPLERMNAADAAFVISTAFLSSPDAARFGYARVPLVQIMESAASPIDRVHRSSPVRDFRASPDGVAFRVGETEHRFESAVLAVSPRSLQHLTRDCDALHATHCDGYEPFAIMDVHLWHDGPAMNEPFAALLGSPVQWVFEKGRGYLCCSISCAGEMVARPSGEMVALAWREAQTLLPALAGARLLRGAATRNPEGTYLALPGTRRPGAATALDNVALAGAWTATGWPDTMESAVRSGYAAAQMILQKATVQNERESGS